MQKILILSLCTLLAACSGHEVKEGAKTASGEVAGGAKNRRQWRG